MGIFTGDSVKRAAERGILKVTLGAMIGKLSKIAAGKLQTHVAGNQVDCKFLAKVAKEQGASDELSAAIATANTARHVQELVESAGLGTFFQQVCLLAAANCKAQATGELTIEAIMFDFEGGILGAALAGFFGVSLAYFVDDATSERVDAVLDLAVSLTDPAVRLIALRSAGLSPRKTASW